MSQVITGVAGQSGAGPLRMSLAFQLRALVLLHRSKTQEEFERDWNTAAAVIAKGYAPPRLRRVQALSVPIDWALNKNGDETEEYAEILRVDEARLEHTRYIQEIQIGKHGRTLEAAMLRARTFRQLARQVEKEGIRRPIYLVDVSAFDLPYWMYRFDGHHRAVCAKYLGLDRVPAYVFGAES